VQTDYFFLFLLPPIIFDAGFNLDVKPCVAAPLSCELAACNPAVHTFEAWQLVGSGCVAVALLGPFIDVRRNTASVCLKLHDWLLLNRAELVADRVHVRCVHACLSAHMCRFFDNMGGISMLAFIGTGISALVVALMMWLLGVLNLSFPIPFFFASLYGAIISATDPVTVLAVFGKLQADVNLNALVFGESVLNDAVAIVLYNVIYKFGVSTDAVTAIGLLQACWSFIYIFASSLLIGVAFALVAAFMFRTSYFQRDHAPVEAALVIIIAYCSFYLADGLEYVLPQSLLGLLDCIGSTELLRTRHSFCCS
jgi:hypothetical protein